MQSVLGYDSTLLALASGIQLTVAIGVTNLKFLRVEPPTTRTASSASVLLMGENLLEMGMVGSVPRTFPYSSLYRKPIGLVFPTAGLLPMVC